LNNAQVFELLRGVGLTFLRVHMKCTTVGTTAIGIPAGDFVTILGVNAERDVRREADKSLTWIYKHTVRCIGIVTSAEEITPDYTLEGDFNYVMAPKDIIPSDKLPKNIGLIEVDLDNLRWERNSLAGVKVTKKAYRTRRDDYGNQGHDEWAEHIFVKLSLALTDAYILKPEVFYPGYGVMTEAWI